MTDLHLAPLPAAQDADALDLLDLTFATDPSLGWYLFAERTGYAKRRHAYLASYQRFHRDNQMPTLAVWQAQGLVGVCYYSLAGQQPSAASVQRIGQAISRHCGNDCLARLDRLLAGFDAHIDARCARIEFIAIAPDQQGRGLGSVLLSQCLVQLKAQGCRNVALETAASRNLPFYRRHGLLQTGGLQIDGLYQHYLHSSGE